MSVELIVFLRSERVPTAKRWAQAIRDAGFELELDDSLGVAGHSGVWPCRYRGHPVGFEFYPDDVEDAEVEPEVEEQLGERDLLVSFIVHGDAREVVCAVIAASVLCAITDGLLFDTDTGDVVGAQDTVQAAKAIEAEHQAELQ